MHRGITGSIRLDNHIFDCSNADSSLADLMLRPTDGVHRCITEFIRLEKTDANQLIYRKFQVSILDFSISWLSHG